MNRRPRLSNAVAVCLILAATLGASRMTARRASTPLTEPLETIPFSLNGFTGVPKPELTDGVLRELKASSYIARRYAKDGLDVDVFVAFYEQQRAGESMHSPKHCLPGAGWEIWKYESIDIPVGGTAFRVNKYSISHAGDRSVVLYWYQSKDRIFASEYLGKLLLARDALLQNSTAAAIVRIIVPDKPEAVEAAGGIASAMILEMRHCFGR